MAVSKSKPRKKSSNALFLFIAGGCLILFFLVAFSFGFNTSLFNRLYPKQKSHAMEPIPTPFPNCPLGTTTPTGQANPSDEPEPMGAIWCFPLTPPAPGFVTRVTGANDWIDEFHTNIQMMRFNDGDLDYRVFDGVVSTRDNSGKTQHFINNNHWMDDNRGNFSGGAMLRPNKVFKFENGKIVAEADVAMGIPCYQDGCTQFGGDEAWPEIVFTQAPVPTNDVVDNLYAYGQFGGYWSVGCRLHGRGAFTCAVETNQHNQSGNDTPPCFTVGPSRLMELSGFQYCGSSHYSYDEHPDARQYLRHCQNNQMDMFCRDRVRMELTKSSLTVYVNGHIYLQDAGWDAAHQLPDSWVNGGDTYVYFADWEDRAPNPLYRFHWGRTAVNPHNPDGTFTALSAAPSFCLGMPQNTCPVDMGGNGSPTPTGMMMSPTPTRVPTPTRIPTPTSSFMTPTPTPVRTTLTPVPGGGKVLGYAKAGGNVDVNDANYINGSKFTMGVTGGLVTSMSVFVASVDTAPHNQYQLAIYTDNNGVPGGLVAKSGTGVLSANAWNTLPITASLIAGRTYWLMYNTNGTTMLVNNMKFDYSNYGKEAYSTNPVAFGNWPQTFPAATLGNLKFSIYASGIF